MKLTIRIAIALLLVFAGWAAGRAQTRSGDVLAITVGQAPQTAVINAAKNTIVRDIDKTLPALRFESWLQGLVGEQTVLTWSVTDCGEQTGNPATDRGRDLPICVEVIANLSGSRRLVLSLLAGSRERGLTVGAVALFSAAIIEPAPMPITWIKTLAEVPKLIGHRSQTEARLWLGL